MNDRSGHTPDDVEFHRALVESIAPIVLVAGADGVLTFVSGSDDAPLGYSSKELVGQSIFGLAHPDGGQTLAAVFAAIVRGEMIEDVNLRFRQKNGSARDLHSHVTNLLDHPIIRGVAISARDVTSLDQLDRDLVLREQFNLLRRFTAQAAHEFNNVMMGIQPATDILRRRADPQLTRFTDLIVNSLSRGKRLTSDVIRYTRRPELSLQRVDLAALVSAAAEHLRREFQDRVLLDLDVPDVALYADADTAQLTEALIELGVNARDAFLATTGTVTLRVHRGEEAGIAPTATIPDPHGYVCISVADTGPGIPAADLPHIFEPLFSTKKGRMGIGLAVVQEIVTGHGGHIVVERNGEGGTTFHLLIPENVTPAI